MAVKSLVSLSDEQHAFARALVEAGRYASHQTRSCSRGVDQADTSANGEPRSLETVGAAHVLLLRNAVKGEFVDRGDAWTLGWPVMIADKRQCARPSCR